MSLQSALGTASSGLASVNQQIAVIAQNVANADTPGYARESSEAASLTADGLGYGVVTGVATQAVDQALSAAVSAQEADVAGAQVRSVALAAVDAAQGVTGAGTDLASRVGALQGAFTVLDADPSNQAQQQGVISAARTLASGITDQAAAYTAARQQAQDGLVDDVTALNTAVGRIGSLSSQIVALRSQGLSTADLQGQRAAQEQTAAQIGGLQFLPTITGDVTALAGGSVVDTRAATGPFSIAPATLGGGSAAPALLLSVTDITAQITTGSIGARITLRDSDLPQAQAGLDEFAKTLSDRLGNQGLSLFTNPAGSSPVGGGVPVQSGYIGYSSIIGVNPAIVASPGLVRDGTQPVAAGVGGASAFTPNPPGGPAGFNTLITRVLQYGFGENAQPGVPQTPPATTGLGPAGGVSLPYSAGPTLQSFAANLAASQARTAGAAQDNVSSGQAVQATLQAKLTSETGVSVDAELSNMVVLQNAYGANAKIITAAQSMWAALLDSVRP